MLEVKDVVDLDEKLDHNQKKKKKPKGTFVWSCHVVLLLWLPLFARFCVSVFVCLVFLYLFFAISLDAPIYQQTLPGHQLLLTPNIVIGTFGVLGVIFLILGIIIVLASNSVFFFFFFFFFFFLTRWVFAAGYRSLHPL